MRLYAKISPRFWIGTTGKAIRGEFEVQILAAYLFSCPNSNMVGMYYLPYPTISHETGIPTDRLDDLFSRLKDLDFADYDKTSEYVFVVEAAREQIGAVLKPGDKQIKGIVNELKTLSRCPFIGEFMRRYGQAYHLPSFLCPFEAPSMGHRSQEQQQQQEQEHETAMIQQQQKPLARGETDCGTAAHGGHPAAAVSKKAIIDLLKTAGLDASTANRLAGDHPPEVISNQVQWLPRRKADKNRLGLLVKSIEENWPEPAGNGNGTRHDRQIGPITHRDQKAYKTFAAAGCPGGDTIKAYRAWRRANASASASSQPP